MIQNPHAGVKSAGRNTLIRFDSWVSRAFALLGLVALGGVSDSNSTTRGIDEHRRCGSGGQTVISVAAVVAVTAATKPAMQNWVVS
jgi:hypothetical protein